MCAAQFFSMVSGTDEAQGEENVMKRTMGKKTEGNFTDYGLE